MKHFLSIKDCTRADILDLLNTADQLKYEHKNNIPHKLLEGKTLGMIFDEVSTRTRVSFEVGMYQLGGNAMFLPTEALQINKGEPVADTARVLSRFLDAVMIRTPSQAALEEYASHSDIPVINGLTDEWHPCQVIGDLMTIREYKISFRGLKIAYIGSGNNVANSLISACAKLGIQISMACPEGFFPADDVIKLGLDSNTLTLTSDPKAAIDGADVVYTGIWHTLSEKYDAAARAKIFEGYTLNSELLSLASPDALVLHCLPATRGEEISADVLEAHSKMIFDQTENRLHAQKAILASLVK
ncbi:MAG: ornithine carbamoyltransferase [Ruminococcaceae bacterium]|nr:ornithine carbamoyltransferase [Oscillospiraceae bacterium]